tara:strand:- start:471 stop:1034 length:564 start_codon:yes stop_codon:yes gene_type:complete
MRIIGGSFKGKKILQPDDTLTRPLKDLTKESIFNIINHSNKFSINLNYAYILDLFSGVGSFGIECLSRGAKKVIFVERYEKVLSILKKNLESLRLINNYEILEKNIDEENIFSNLVNEFDVIFLDPPYKDKNLFKILFKIEKNKILKKNGIIIIHRHKNEKDIFPPNFRILEEKKYGISKIIFMNYL